MVWLFIIGLEIIKGWFLKVVVIFYILLWVVDVLFGLFVMFMLFGCFVVKIGGGYCFLYLIFRIELGDKYIMNKFNYITDRKGCLFIFKREIVIYYGFFMEGW